MILKTLQVGDQILRLKAKPLMLAQLRQPLIQQLIDHMVDTLRDAPGVGLAAPQVGANVRIIIIEDKAEYHKKISQKLLKEQDRQVIPLTIIVNPKLNVTDAKTASYFEGCLSVTGYRAVVPRALEVTVTGFDQHGKAISIEATGWYARILQHECDHLEGNLYIDQMESRSFMTDKAYAKDWADKTAADLHTF